MASINPAYLQAAKKAAGEVADLFRAGFITDGMVEDFAQIIAGHFAGFEAPKDSDTGQPLQPNDPPTVVATLEIGDYSDGDSIYATPCVDLTMTIEQVRECDKLITLKSHEGVVANLAAGVIPAGYRLVPEVPSKAHLVSIAQRDRHDFGLLSKIEQKNLLGFAKQLYEEAIGMGFYSLAIQNGHGSDNKASGNRYKVLPKTPTPEMWGGLARDLMMWLDLNSRPTVESLRKHLASLGMEWPAWMDEENELKGDGVPSKGTRAALIYMAMWHDAPDLIAHGEQYLPLNKLTEGLGLIADLSRNLRDGGCGIDDLPGVEEGLQNAVDLAGELLSLLSSAQKEPIGRWHGVSELLPPEDLPVFCICEDDRNQWLAVAAQHNGFFYDPHLPGQGIEPVRYWAYSNFPAVVASTGRGHAEK